jgi:hypothetical protein
MTKTQDASHPTEIPDFSLDQVFRQARTYTAWHSGRIPAETLREIYELAR